MNSLRRLVLRLPEPLLAPLRTAYHVATIQAETPEHHEQFSAYIRPGDTVLDVGANIGYFSFYLARLVGPRGRVIAFEPAEHTFRTLRLSKIVHRARNLDVVHAAVTSTPGSVRMAIPKYDDQTSLNYFQCQITDSNGSQNAANSFEVRAVTIDSMNVSPSFIKIDVEGHELGVLQGAEQTIARCHPVLLVEVSSPASTNFAIERGYRDMGQIGSDRLFVHQ